MRAPEARERKEKKNNVNRMIRKTACVVTAGIWLLALFGGLWFAGFFSPVKDPLSAAGESMAEGSADQPRIREVTYKGMKFFLPEKGMVGIHASGCLNIRQVDRYLIQIEISDGTVEELWEEWSQKRELLLETGYRMEKEAELLEGEEGDYIRYVISLDDGRWSDFDRTYFDVVMAPADEGRHFLTVILYDKIDVENLDEATREKVFAEAFVRASAILAAACPTDEADEEPGTVWYEDKSLDPERRYVTEGTIVYKDGKHSLSYQLPERCMLTGDDAIGKTYYDEDDQIYVTADVVKHHDPVKATAKSMAESNVKGNLSRPHTSGEVQVNGRTFYYCTRTVVDYQKRKMVTTYTFDGFCDLGAGNVYCIHGYSEKSPKTLEPEYYLEWMDITVF